MILLSHPTGNATARAALDGLLEQGALTEFHTSVATFPGNVWDRLGSLGPLSDFGRRRYNPALADRTRQHPWHELGRMAANRLGLVGFTAHERGLLSVDAIYRNQDKRVARRLDKLPGLRGVYTFEDGAYHTFERGRQLGITNLYELPIGYWRAARDILGKVVSDRPEWAMTVNALKDSPEKLTRKDRELALADHIFVASSFTASTLERYPGELAPVTTIPFGFPPVYEARTYAPPAPGRPLRLLFVGGLSQRKGLAEMFAAVDRLGNRVSLTVLGRKAGGHCPVLEEALARHRYIPSLPHAEVLRLMREHDLLLFPSHFEGFGLVITEAMSQGTPVITTGNTAGPDLITEGEDGFVVPAGSTEAIAERIEALLQRPARLADMGRAAAARAARRPWSAYGSELAETIQNILR